MVQNERFVVLKPPQAIYLTVVPHAGQTNNMIGIKLAYYRKKIGNDFLIRLIIERVCMTLGMSGINYISRQKMI